MFISLKKFGCFNIIMTMLMMITTTITRMIDDERWFRLKMSSVKPYAFKEDSSPFIWEVSEFFRLDKFPIPQNIGSYDGTTDPDDYIFVFTQTMGFYSLSEHDWCRLFVTNLRGAARMWFKTLQPQSISSFEQLVKSFRTEYLHNVKFQKSTNDTKTRRQQTSHNSVDENLERFSEFLEKTHLSIKQLLSPFINGNEPGRAVKDFSTKNDLALEDLLNEARSFTILDDVHIKLPETESFIEALPRSAYSNACILEFDGAFKGNPGSAGAGVVLRAIDGSLVYRVREGLGNATCHVAEYHALILGLRYALKKGFRHICVHGDSKNVCMQVNGLRKAKSQNMVDMCKVVKELKEKFLSFQISHCDKEKNSEADTQANLAVLLKNGEVEEEVEKI